METSCSCALEHQVEKKLLGMVLLINAGMFFVEITAGWVAESSALLADSLDMLADAFVYGISFYAVGKSRLLRANAALMSGSLQLLLGIGVMLDVFRKIWITSTPEPLIMGTIGFIALLANATCFLLLWRHRNSEINLKSSWICSRNDILANLGVILAGGLVSLSGTAYPDWVIGSIMAVIIIYSSLRIIQTAFGARVLG